MKQVIKLNILILGSNIDGTRIADEINHLQLKATNHFIRDEANISDQELADVDIILGWDKPVVTKILAMPNAKLKWIQAYSAGVDYYPLQQLAKRNVLLSNVSGIHAEPISENVLGMILSFYRGIHTAATHQSSGQWTIPDHQLETIAGKKMVIFGTGHIGSRIAQLAAAFNLSITGVNHSGHPVKDFPATISIDALDSQPVREADIIVNTMPLTAQTTGFFNHSFFDLVDNQPLFVTIGRGPSTVTADLVLALQNHQIGGAALDVTDPEPLPSTSPLWQMPNVIITPHISGLYQNYFKDAINIFAENLKQFETDGILKRNEVNLSAGY